MKVCSFGEKQFFGEYELLFKENEDESKRKWTIVCESADLGEVYAIKRSLFVNKIMGDFNGKRWML
jgi:hypothetical protein